MIEQSTINPNEQIQGWVIEAFNLPKETVVYITSPPIRRRWTPLAYGIGRLISPIRRNHISKRECIEERLSSMDTVIIVHSCKDHTHEYTIPKPPDDIKYEDIELLRTTDGHKHHTHKKNAILGYLFRFSIWWAGISGIYAITVACPCCGQVGCPVGVGSASLVGGFLALCKQSGKGFIKSAYSKLFRRD
jgi:hypothetical protein